MDISRETTCLRTTTAAIESVLLMAIVNVCENRDVVVFDLPNPFIQKRVENEKNKALLSPSSGNGLVGQICATIITDKSLKTSGTIQAKG